MVLLSLLAAGLIFLNSVLLFGLAAVVAAVMRASVHLMRTYDDNG